MSRARTKVAVVIGALEVGGAELDIVRNFPRLDREAFEVVVVAFGWPGPLARQIEEAGIRVIARRPDDGGAMARAAAGEGETPAGAGPGSVTRLGGVSGAVHVVGEAAPWMRCAYRAVGGAVAGVARRAAEVAHYLATAWWIGGVLARERADIAHAFLPHSYVYSTLAGRLRRRSAKQVMSRLSLNFYADDVPLVAWMERHYAHRRVDIAIGNAPAILDELAHEGVARERLRLLHNGIDTAPFARSAEARVRVRVALDIVSDAFVIVAVGNLHTYKGHVDLLEACALACERLPERWALVVAGRDQDGNRSALEQRARELGLEEHVRLLGAWDDVPGLLSAADVFAHPSRHEGMPNAIIEAMSASLPVIGTSVGGIPELVVARPESPESATGWLVPSESPRDLAAALVEAASDSAQRTLMGANALVRARSEFSLERSVAAYEAIYRELRR